MQKRKLTLDDRELVSEKLNALDIHLAEFCFPNLYFFRGVHEYEILEMENITLLGGVSYDGKRYLMPLHAPSEDPAPCLKRVKTFLSETDYDCIFPIPEEWLCCFPEEEFRRSYHDGDTDYLFLTEKMSVYPGKKMHKKKNLKNQFLKSYEPFFRELNAENRADALYLLDLWQNASSHELEVNDYGPLQGSAGRYGRVRAFRLCFLWGWQARRIRPGEPLNPSTFTIHFAKADIRFKGIYAYMFSEFCGQIKDRYEYINMEQDLDKPGLRQTKKSYSGPDGP